MDIKNKIDAFKEIALERRSIRNYDTTVDISQEEMTEILEMATKAPSSSNMQPWRFVVVNRSQVKEKLLPYVQFNITPASTASAILAVFGDLESTQNADDIFAKTSEIRGEDVNSIFSKAKLSEEADRKNPREMISKSLKSMTKEQKQRIALIDCGLVSMQLMLAARVFGYDTCALGAYDKESVSKVLGMDDERYVPVMLISIGKAMETGMSSYRLPVSAVVKFFE